MVITHIPEPYLEFGNGIQHVDIRFGLMENGPHDIDKPQRREKIQLGIIGSPESIDGVTQWLDKCREPIERKKNTEKKNLFPGFPGFNETCCFRSTIVTDSSLEQTVNPRDYTNNGKDWPYENRIRHAAQVFAAGIEALAEKTPDVILLAMPNELVSYLADSEENRKPDKSRLKMEFHDMIKGLSLRCGRPLQVIRPSTYGGARKEMAKDSRAKTQSIQDEATRAWNFHTALYYKAGGFPYRVPRNESDYQTCFIGISYFVSPDKERIQTSVANVFNERGHGLAVKGKEATYSKDDRQYHLSADDAAKLITECLAAYRTEHQQPPARVVIHKSSPFNQNEIDGINDALDQAQINMRDLLSLNRNFLRLYRENYYPPLRGTCLEADKKNLFLYTRGSIPFYQEYPGMYVPRSLGIRIAQQSQSNKKIMEELMVLSKTNWNNVQIDATMPITVTAARTVGEILRWLPENIPTPQPYRFYM